MFKPTPTQMVEAMIEAAQAAETAADLPAVGTFARQYGESIEEDLNAENVGAFMQGSAVINLLVQEAILRITTVAKENMSEVESDNEVAYNIGVNDGAMMIAQLMGGTAEKLIHSLIEGPAIDRQFNSIVSNFTA